MGFGAIGRGSCRFQRFDGFAIFPNKAIRRAIGPDLTRVISDLIIGIVGASAATLCAGVVDTFDSGQAITAADVDVLRHVRTIEMGTGGEGAADTENNSKRQNGPFELFHTKLFLVRTME